MPRANSSRESVLDAFEQIVLEQGERVATLNAVAEQAGVSKGGLLYHFASKQALIDGLLDRLAALVEADLAWLREGPESVVERFIRSSTLDGSSLDRTFTALARIVQSTDHPDIRPALARVEAAWHELVLEEVGDPDIARIVVLASDGLYFRGVLDPQAPQPDDADLDRIVRTLGRLASRS
jgi:AcrR family transcriptional regulator